MHALTDLESSSYHNEIVFIDSQIQDVETLLAGINPYAEVIMLSADQDGMEQIADVLGERQDIDAVHILSHGEAGVLQLGTGTLTSESMQTIYSDELDTIAASLSDQADILIYGCNFADGADGQQAVQMFSELTGADIAASDDATGSASHGGDWDLEVKQGEIETGFLFNDYFLDDWDGSLNLAPTSGPVADTYTVSGNGLITITITGADGGDGFGNGNEGGQGATVTATFEVSDGDQIHYVVGEAGAGGNASAATGGGGGSTGIYINDTLVMVAGGGGGGDNSRQGLGANDADLVNGEDGDNGTQTNAGAGGLDGAGGGAYTGGGGNGGGGGGGVLSAGGTASSTASGGAASSAGLLIEGVETASLVSGGTSPQGGGDGDGGSGFTGGGAGASFYSGAGGGYSGGGAAGTNGASGGGGSWVNIGHSGYVTSSSDAGGTGLGVEADGTIEISFDLVPDGNNIIDVSGVQTGGFTVTANGVLTFVATGADGGNIC